MEEVYDIVKPSTIPLMHEKIMAVAEDPGATRDDLIKVIEYDMALAARVLELANAAHHGYSRKIITLNGAISLLGSEAVERLALSSSIFTEISSGAGDKITSFWRHSFEVAKASAILAKITLLVRPETAFIAGLLHDLGRAILYQLYGDDYIATSASSEDIVTEEEKLYGASHADVGSWFADKCNFPEDLVMAIRLHHVPESYLLSPRTYLPIIYLADYIVSQEGDGPGVDYVKSQDHEKVVSILHIDKATMKKFREEVKAIHKHTCEYYSG